MKDKKMSTSTATSVKTDTTLKAPPMFKVIYVNDNATSVSFVIASLVNHFSYGAETAEEIASKIHTQGSAIAAVLPFELAEQKGIEVTVDARKAGFPLQIKIEKDLH